MKIHPCLSLFLLALFLTACGGTAPTPVIPTATASDLPTATAPAAPTQTPPPTETPTATAIRTPPELPPAFSTSSLNPLDTPHTYIQDACQYLQDKWSSKNSAPGTVVMVIAFHSISDTDSLSALMQALHENGFQAIRTAQLADFMEKNAKIPPRSVLLVVDDRRTKEYYDAFFRPYWEQYGWPVVNAWISTDQSSADLWQQQVDLEKEGWVDHEAHGVVHNTPMDNNVSEAYIHSELQGSIDAFQEHFGKSPIAIIWPGGLFSHRATQIARELGYRLGFTYTPRGPVMFNWVPLTDVADPARPYWPQEGYVEDPLMVLPRYWDTDAIQHLDTVMQIGQDAAAYAQANKATELEYYDILCAPAYGPIP